MNFEITQFLKKWKKSLKSSRSVLTIKLDKENNELYIVWTSNRQMGYYYKLTNYISENGIYFEECDYISNDYISNEAYRIIF
jgi:hypothetical protein